MEAAGSLVLPDAIYMYTKLVKASQASQPPPPPPPWSRPAARISTSPPIHRYMLVVACIVRSMDLLASAVSSHNRFDYLSRIMLLLATRM